MRAAPPDFPDLLDSSDLSIAVKLEAYYAGQWLGEIPVEDASIVWDDGSLVAGKLKFTAPDPEVWWVPPPLAVRWIEHGSGGDAPAITDTPLGTDGHRIRASYGLRRPGGRDTAWVQLGWFRISDAVPDGGYINVTAPDLMDAVQRARFLTPKGLLPGNAAYFAIQTLTYPLVPSRIINTAQRNKPLAAKSWDRERLEAVQDVLEILPATGYLDASGTFVIEPSGNVPDLGPVLRGGPGGTALNVRKVATPDSGFNACVAIGRDGPTGQDIVGIAYVSDGPRRWDGPYGRNPGFYSSEMLTTVDQCRQTATAMLKRWQERQAEVWRVEMAPDPRLELRDRRPIVYSPDGVGDARVGVCTSVELQLNAEGGAMVADFALEA